MKTKLALLTLSLLAGQLVPTASAIVTAPGFQDPNAGVYSGGQLSGLGAYSDRFAGITEAAGTAFVAWEKFNAPTFTGFASQYSNDSGGLSATLSQLNVGPTLSTSGSNPGHHVVGGEDYYGRLATGPYDFAISATSTLEVGRVVLGIKHTPFFDIDFNPIVAFTATLNGVASQPLFETPNFGNYSDPLSGPGTISYFFYTWDLDIAAGDPLVLSFASGPDQLGFGFSVDTIALSVQSIPEPSSMVLLSVGMAGAMFLKRRRQRA